MSSTTDTPTDQDYFIESYGDLIFELSISLLRDVAQAQSASRSILKRIGYKNRFQKYTTYEQGWVLKATCDRLLKLYDQSTSIKAAKQQTQLDTSLKNADPITHFQLHFNRLPPDDQLLLLLKDKLQISYSDISMALDIPQGSLKVKRQQAIKTLEEWIWTTE